MSAQSKEEEEEEEEETEKRFKLGEVGRRVLMFESEAEILDALDVGRTIIVKSGYTDIESTGVYAQEIVDLLNEAHEKTKRKGYSKTRRNS